MYVFGERGTGFPKVYVSGFPQSRFSGRGGLAFDTTSYPDFLIQGYGLNVGAGVGARQAAGAMPHQAILIR